MVGNGRGKGQIPKGDLCEQQGAAGRLEWQAAAPAPGVVLLAVAHVLLLLVGAQVLDLPLGCLCRAAGHSKPSRRGRQGGSGFGARQSSSSPTLAACCCL